VGISTRTLYRLFATKEDLLREAMELRIDEAFGQIDIEKLDIADGRKSLTVLLDSYAQLMLSDDAVRLTRLIAAERHEVPGLVESYRQSAARIAAIFDDWIGQQQRRGFLDADRSKHAADLLRGMINEAQRQILLGLREPLTDEERRAWVSAAATLFLDGCAARR
jgi:AcrR family transcriptional regulator